MPGLQLNTVLQVRTYRATTSKTSQLKLDPNPAPIAEVAAEVLSAENLPEKFRYPNNSRNHNTAIKLSGVLFERTAMSSTVR